MDPTKRKAQIVAELQALDAENRGCRLSPDAWQHWQRLERELDEVEERISAALEAVADVG